MNSSKEREVKVHDINSEDLDFMYFQCMKNNNFKALIRDINEHKYPKTFQGMRQYTQIKFYLSLFFNPCFCNQIARFYRGRVKISMIRKY
jgi:hypothetical protein